MAAAATWLGGLVIDIDHVPDYFWTRRRGQKSHYFAPLHSWELLAGLVALGKLAYDRARRRPLPDHVVQPQTWTQAFLTHPWTAPALIGLTAGMWFHLVLDVLVNRPKHAGVYTLVYRIRHRFSREATGWTEENGFHHWSTLHWYQWYRAI